MFTEGFSAAHLVRPLVLGRWLQAAGFQVAVACPSARAGWFALEGWTVHDIEGHDPQKVYACLRKGRDMFDLALLQRAYQRDRELIEQTRPDLVVADFRFSALQWAERLGIPNVGVTDTTCHPRFAFEGTFPDNLARPAWLPIRLFDAYSRTRLFAGFRASIVSSLAEPLRRASAAHGLEPLETFLDYASLGRLCLLFDDPLLMPLPQLRPQDLYVGAVRWSAPASDGQALAVQAFCRAGPTVYVSAGTQPALPEPILCDYLRRLLAADVRVLLSTGGRVLEGLPQADDRLMVCPFVDQAAVLGHVRLFVHPSGAMSCYDGLLAGVPMLLLPAITTQHYYARAVEKLGTGRLVYLSRTSPSRMLDLTQTLMSDAGYAQRAKQVRQALVPDAGRDAALQRIGHMMRMPIGT